MTAISPCGVCWRYAASLVSPRRLRDASYSLWRGPAISWLKCFHCSVFPGSIGKAIASDAIFLISFTCMMFQGKHFLPHVSILPIPYLLIPAWGSKAVVESEAWQHQIKPIGEKNDAPAETF